MLERKGFGIRLGAYVIDGVIVAIIWQILWAIMKPAVPDIFAPGVTLDDVYKWAERAGGRSNLLLGLCGLGMAAVLDVKLDHLNDWNGARQRNAALYREALSSVVITPAAEPYQTNHVFNQFVIRCQRRDELRAFLAESGVGTEIYYPLPLHLQPALASYGYKAGDFPVSEQLAKEVLALPIFAELTEEEITTVAALIREFYQRG